MSRHRLLVVLERLRRTPRAYRSGEATLTLEDGQLVIRVSASGAVKGVGDWPGAVTTSIDFLYESAKLGMEDEVTLLMEDGVMTVGAFSTRSRVVAEATGPG